MRVHIEINPGSQIDYDTGDHMDYEDLSPQIQPSLPYFGQKSKSSHHKKEKFNFGKTMS